MLSLRRVLVGWWMVIWCGRTLAQYITNSERELEEKEILLMCQQMVDALCYIHSNNILHRLVLGECCTQEVVTGTDGKNKQADRQTDRQTDGLTDRWTDRQTDRWMDGDNRSVSTVF